MTADPAQLIGETIDERYTVRELLGEGGMGIVYRALDTEDDRTVAIKILSSPGEESVSDRFAREARVLSKLRHDNVVEIYDAGSLKDGRPYIVMEHLAGESLDARQRREPLELDVAREVVLGVCEALRAVHGLGVVHRDLKPQNIFLVESSPGARDVGRVVVLDFGISKMLGSMTVETKSSVLLGTPQYMAPEQARGDHELISPRTDLFSLGVIAYELLSGKMPFDGESVYEIVYRVTEESPPPLADVVDDCPAPLSNTIAKAMAKDPRERFATAEELAGALRGEIEVEPPSRDRRDEIATIVDKPVARPTTESEPPVTTAADPVETPAPPRRWWIPAIAVLVLVAAGAGGYRLMIAAPDDPAVFEAVVASVEARALGDLGLEADAADNPAKALDFLVRAYAGGDDRQLVRIALRHRIRDAEAVVFAKRFDTPIQQVTVSEDGQRVVPTSASGSWVFDSDGNLQRFARAKRVLTFSTKRTYEAAIEGQERLVITRADDGETVHTVQTVSAFMWHDDNRILVMRRDAAGRPTFALIDVVSREAQWHRVCPSYTQVLVGFSDDRSRMITCDRPVIVDIATGEPLLVAGKATRDPRTGGTALNANGTIGVFAAEGQKLEVYDVDRKKQLVVENSELGAGSRWVALSPKGDLMVATTQAGFASYRIETQPLRATLIRQFGVQVSFESIKFVNNETLAVGTASGVIRLISPATGATLGRLVGHQSPVEGMALAGDQFVTMAGTDVRVWRLSGRPVKHLGTEPATVNRFAHGGRRLMIYQRAWKQFDLEAGTATPLPGQPKLTPDRETMLIDKVLYDVASGRELARLESDEGSISMVSNDGAIITTYQPVAVYRRDGARYRKLEAPIMKEAFALQPSHDGERLAVVLRRGERLQDYDITVVETNTGKRLETHEAPVGIPFATFLTPDHVLTPIVGGLHIWSWRTGKVQHIDGGAAPFVAADGVAVTHRGGETLMSDLETLRPVASTSACVTGPLQMADNRIVSVRCRIGTRLLLWDGEAAWILPPPEFDHSRISMVDIDKAGKRLAVSGPFGTLLYDLTPEDRPVDTIRAIHQRSVEIERLDTPR